MPDGTHEHNCPFYGQHMIVVPEALARPFLLAPQEGNECAIILGSFSPCQMEMEGNTPDWKECPVLRQLNLRRLV